MKFFRQFYAEGIFQTLTDQNRARFECELHLETTPLLDTITKPQYTSWRSSDKHPRLLSSNSPSDPWQDVIRASVGPPLPTSSSFHIHACLPLGTTQTLPFSHALRPPPPKGKNSSSSHQPIKQRPSQDKRTQPSNQFSRPKFLHRTTEISPRSPFRQQGVNEDRNDKASDEVEEEAVI